VTTFSLDYIPIKRRVRFSRRGSTYIDKTTKQEMEGIAAAYESAGGRFLEGAIAITIDIFAPLPDSKPKRISSESFTCKPDVDNVAKSVMDALTGLAYRNDSQVTKLTIRKHPRERGSVTSVYVSVKEDLNEHN